MAIVMIIAVSTILVMTVTFDDVYAHNPSDTPIHMHPHPRYFSNEQVTIENDFHIDKNLDPVINVHPQVRELNIKFTHAIDKDNVDLSKFVIKNLDHTRSITLQGAEIIDVSNDQKRITIKVTSSQANTIKGYTGTTSLESQRGGLVSDRIIDWRAFELLPNAVIKRDRGSVSGNAIGNEQNMLQQDIIRMNNIAPDPTLEELQAKVRTLESQIKTLESANKRLQTLFDDAQNACLVEQSSSTPVQQRSEQQLQTDGQGTPVQQQQQQQVIVNPVNLIENGSFESPQINNNGATWQIFTDINGWTISDKLELQRDNGEQYAELDATRHTSTAISQTLNTISGQDYTLSFDYRAKPGTAANTNGISVTWNNAEIASGITFGNNWQTFSSTVTATGSDIISLSDAGISDGEGTFLDNVSVIAILP